jgi:hypothetical protein
MALVESINVYTTRAEARLTPRGAARTATARVVLDTVGAALVRGSPQSEPAGMA